MWSAISKEDLQEMEASSKETHGILDELISTIPNADVHVLFTEVEEGGLKASMRSSAAVDCSRLAGETYGGGGHARASGFRVRTFSNFQLQVIECVQKLKEGMERQRKEGDAPRAVPEAHTPMQHDQQATSAIEVKTAEEKKQPPKERDIVQDLTKGTEGSN